MWYSFMSVFPDTSKWKQEWNKTDTEEVGKQRRVNKERSTAGMQKKKSQWPKCSSGLPSHPESLLPEVVDELINEL